MIYGDNPQKINEREDALGLKRYSYAPQISAVVQSGNLYVYCMGNPVYYVDIEGELSWPGEIHNKVVEYIAHTHSFNKEQIITYNFGWGRADLISNEGSVWDVKRNKPREIASGVKQVENYVANTWKNDPKTRLSVGGYIEPGSFIYKSGSITYTVSYYYAGDGVIAYDYEEVVDAQEILETAEEVIGLVGILVLTCIAVVAIEGLILIPVVLV